MNIPSYPSDREQIESNILRILSEENALQSGAGSMDPLVRKTLEDVLILNRKFKAKEKWFSEAQRLAKIGSWELDLVTKDVFWSDEIFAIFGMDPSEKIPGYEEYLQKIYIEDRQAVKEGIEQAKYKGEPYKLEVRHVMPDGELHWVMSICNPILDEKNNVVKLHGISYDIDERKRGELALRASEQFFRALIHNSSDYVLTVNSEGKILYQSPTFERLTGYTLEERLGKSVLELLHPDYKADAYTFLTDVSGQEGKAKSMEMKLIRKDGRVIWIESTLTNLLAEKGVEAIVVNTREITDRKLAEEKLIQQNEELKN